jgi:threonine/homoserine/homoserine lactone efflux protein
LEFRFLVSSIYLAGVINPGPNFLAMLCVMFVIASTWYGAVAMLFSAPAVSDVFQRLKAWFDRFCGATIVILGLKQAFGSSNN